MTPCPRQEIKEKETALSVEQADLDSDGLTSFWNTRWWTLRIEICFKKNGKSVNILHVLAKDIRIIQILSNIMTSGILLISGYFFTSSMKMEIFLVHYKVTTLHFYYPSISPNFWFVIVIKYCN